MIYVLDTNVFIVLTHYYPSAFPSLWTKLDESAEAGMIVSVREVFNELKQTNESGFLQEWVDRNKSIFKRPTNAELQTVRQILAIPHFQALINAKAMLRGTPVADPFVIAAAKAIVDSSGERSAAVVTQEKEKPNAAKIPNVCRRFNVPCMDLHELMTEQGWTF